MPDSCRIDAEVQARPPYLNGLATNFTVLGHASRSCTRVHVFVRVSQNGPVIFEGFAQTQYQLVQPGTDPAAPENDGLWQLPFLGPPTGLPCGLQLWVDAICIDGGGTCEAHGWRGVECKQRPGSGPGGVPPGS